MLNNCLQSSTRNHLSQCFLRDDTIRTPSTRAFLARHLQPQRSSQYYYDKIIIKKEKIWVMLNDKNHYKGTLHSCICLCSQMHWIPLALIVRHHVIHWTLTTALKQKGNNDEITHNVLDNCFYYSWFYNATEWPEQLFLFLLMARSLTQQNCINNFNIH